jgi:3-oxoacyl-[acyl-carrier protein] reductase
VDLEGKVAIVTGAATGVGRATTLALARRGCAVLVNYRRSKEAAEETVAEASALGARSIAWQADVSDDGACRAMVDAVVSEFGALHILVNNAGTTVFISHAELERVSDADWDRILAVNLKGPFQCARAARGAIDAAGGGEIVNVSSVAGLVGTGSSIPYCASKAALNNLTLTLARALAPRIRVNAVAPGFIAGEWLKQGLGDGYEAIKEAFERRSPLNKVCEPGDVADAIVSLIGGSDLVTGQVLACEGGVLLA